MEYLSRNTDVQTRYIRMVEGVKNVGNVSMKPLIAGERMTLLEIRYPPEGGAAAHIHQHETVCYVVSGRVKVQVADVEFEMGPGDTCVHPMGVPHGILGIEDAVVIEIKSPAQAIEAFLGTSEN